MHSTTRHISEPELRKGNSGMALTTLLICIGNRVGDKMLHTEVNQGHNVVSNKLNIFLELLLSGYDSDFVELKYNLKVIFTRSHDIILHVFIYATWLDRHAVRQLNLTLM